MKNRQAISKISSRILPPLFAQYFRQLVFPFKNAIKEPEYFTRKAITGSSFSGITSDIHAYSFCVHGFFDWRNLLIAKAIINANEPDLQTDIIEIGANIGTETICFADILRKKGTVHAFEPVTSNIKELEKIKKDNQALQIQIYPVTIGDQSTTLDFILPPANYSGMGKISTADTNQLSPKIQVEVRPLDSFIDSFRNVRAIFIDVEGYEPAVLKGSKKVIAKFRPTVILEVSSSLLMECGYTSQNIFSFFTENGYVCYNIGRFKINKVSSTADYSNTHTNWICIPIEDNSSLKRIKKLLYIHIFLPLTKIKTEINNY